MNTEPTEVRIAKLELRPTDMLVIMTAVVLSTRQRDWMQEMLKRQLPPGTRTLILDGGVTMAVLSGEHLAQRDGESTGNA